MADGATWPEGLVYLDEFVSPDEEREAVAFLEGLEFETVTMRGQAARRTVLHYGFHYDYSGRGLAGAEPLPEELAWIRDRLAPSMRCAPEELAQVLVQRYPAGAGIGWHRDAETFGPRIGGVSLLGAARMRFRRTVDGVRETAAVELPARSAYVLAGEARSSWAHSVPPTKELRYSLTFRMLRGRAGSGPPAGR
jgi:DNA oxidative demethylase